MNRRNILILLVIAAIFAAIIFTLLQKNSGIENVIISEDAKIQDHKAENIPATKLNFSTGAQLYAVIFIKNIKPDDSISIKWLSIKDSREMPVQEDIITVKNEEGSGRVTVSLAKKNNIYDKGEYRVIVSFKDQEIKREFIIE